MIRIKLKQLLDDKAFKESRRITLNEVSEASGIARATLNRIAHELKRFILYPGAEHGLDEAAEEVHAAVRDWILEHLQAEEQP